MQLKSKISIITSALLISSSLNAEDYVRVNYLQYNESDDRVQVQAPSFEINKDFGVDYTLNTKFVVDSVSGGTPIYSDTSSGASAFARGKNIEVDKIKKQNVDMSESRTFANINLIKRFENRNELSSSFSKSYESDYDSNTLALDYLFYADKSKNRSYNIGVAYQINQILVKNCSEENYICDGVSGASKKEDSSMLSNEFGITQIIDKTSLAKFSVFYSNEDGYLSNPYYNVIRNNDGIKADVVAERRPDKRVSSGFNLKYIKALSDDFSTNLKYKYYRDDWGINSHTIDVNNYYEYSKMIFGFGFRYYKQKEADFYSDDIKYFTNQTYASSDDRLSNFNSNTYKTSIEYKYSDKISYNFAFNLYKQSTGLDATYTSLGLKYSF